MSTVAPFIPRPLFIAIKWASLVPFMLFGHIAQGAMIPVDGTVRDVDASSPANDYSLRNGAILNVNGGAQHGAVFAERSSVTMAADTEIESAQLGLGSSIALTGATVRNGLSVNQSTGTITDGTLRSTAGTALTVNRQSIATSGSTVTLANSSSIGGTAGALVTHFSQLTLSNSDLAGTGATGVGLRLNAGSASASDSRIRGTENGVWIASESGYGDSSLILDASHVTGQNGAAIRVQRSSSNNAQPEALIEVNNGSTLTGGNGNILEVADNATATMNVNNSNLSGTVQVDATSTANLNFNRASLSGDVIAESGGIANVKLDNGSLLTGRLENTGSVALNGGSQWTMVDNGSVENLSLSDGFVQLGDAASFYTLSVASLSGNGTFKMDVDFGGAQTDFLDVTGTATGSHQLLIGSTGTDPTRDTSLHVVHAEAGDSSFSLVGGRVDLGTWSYELVKQGANDWYLDASTRVIAPGPATAIALFNASPTVWYGELSTLRTRMGELRFNGGRSGGWMRTYGNKFNVANASGFGYKQVQQGIALGADGKLPVGDGQWLAGVMAGQSTSDLSLDRGASGKIDSYYVGAYSTWLDSDTGYYFDGVLKFNRFRNKARVNLSDGSRTKGDYSNSGAGASLEFGRHIKLDDGYYIEPYTQLAAAVIEGKDYTLDNGLRAEGEKTRSVLGKAGATVGRNFDLGQGRAVQPYVRAALAHEFVKNNQVRINDNRFDNDVSGSRGELGAGIAVAFFDKLEAHADFEYSNGSRIEQPWGANVGLRYNW
jgi:outer membrane autotransporter protein